MPDNQASERRRVRERAAPLSAVPNFGPEGLVLGVGTVLLRAEELRRLQSLAGRETQVLALLSAAYGRAVAPSVLGNIERAAEAWRQGDDCLAYIHLAHACLGELPYPHVAAQRLVIADAFLQAGGSPRAIFEALKAGRSYIDALQKDFNADEPRVPAGSGKPSGQWTRGLVGPAPPQPSFVAPGTASWLGELAPPAAASLGEYALSLLSGVGGAVAAFGLLFVPSSNKIHVEGEVEGIPGLRYSWNRDETAFHLTYDDPHGGQRTYALSVDGEIIRDEQGRAIGRVISDNNVAIDVGAVAADLVKKGEPQLCPAPGTDVPGSNQGKPYAQNRARQYEDYVKAYINPPPDGPTPSGFVYYLPSPEPGRKAVSYDDCQQKTGIMFEIKGLRYSALLQASFRGFVMRGMLAQAGRQVDASGGRPLIWVFAEEDAATRVRELFDVHDKLKTIYVWSVPWEKRESR